MSGICSLSPRLDGNIPVIMLKTIHLLPWCILIACLPARADEWHIGEAETIHEVRSAYSQDVFWYGNEQRITASSMAEGSKPHFGMDHHPATGWQPKKQKPWQLTQEFPMPVRLSMIRIARTWDQTEQLIGPGYVYNWGTPIAYTIEVSMDGKSWQTVVKETENRLLVRYHYFPSVKARLVRLDVTETERGRPPMIGDLRAYNVPDPAEDGSRVWWHDDWGFRTRVHLSASESKPGVRVLRRRVAFRSLAIKDVHARVSWRSPRPEQRDEELVVGSVRVIGHRPDGTLGPQPDPQGTPCILIPEARFRQKVCWNGEVIWLAGLEPDERSYYIYFKTCPAGQQAAARTEPPTWSHRAELFISGGIDHHEFQFNFPGAAVRRTLLLNSYSRTLWQGVGRNARTKELDATQVYFAIGMDEEGKPVALCDPARWPEHPDYRPKIVIPSYTQQGEEMPQASFGRGSVIPVTVSAKLPKEIDGKHPLHMLVRDERGREWPRETRTVRIAQGTMQAELEVQTNDLAPGDYDLIADLAVGKRRLAAAKQYIRIVSDKPYPFRRLIYDVPIWNEGRFREDLVRQAMRYGFSVLDWNHPDYAFAADELGRCGVRFSAKLKPAWVLGKGPEELRSRSADGKLGRRACLVHPKVKAAMREHVVGKLSPLVRFPAFDRSFYFNDDGQLALQYDYSEPARKLWKQVTGLDAIPVYEDEKKRAPADGSLLDPKHPWLQWLIFRCDKLLTESHRVTMAARDEVDPGLRGALVHGPMQIPFLCPEAAIYAPYDQAPCDVISSYYYASTWRPRKSHVYWYEVGQMGNRGKDAWMLESIGYSEYGRRGNEPAYAVREKFWAMVAAGYRSVGWFIFTSIREHRQGFEEVGRLSGIADRLGPVWMAMRPAPSRVALLCSLSSIAGDQLHGLFDQHGRAIKHLHAELLANGVAAEVVAEEEILGGRLEQYDAIVATGLRFIRRDVYDLLNAYAEAQGKLLVVQPGCTVKFPGARELSIPEAIQACHGLASPFAALDTRDAYVREHRIGEDRFVFLVNTYSDRWSGGRNLYDIMDVPRVATNLRIAEKGWLAFDLLTGEAFDLTNGSCPIEIPSAGARFLAFYRQPISGVKLNAPRPVTAGRALRLSIGILDPDGKAVEGTQAVELSFYGPDGVRSRYHSGTHLVTNGALALAHATSINEPPGRWRLQARELASGETAEATVEVKQPEGD